MPQTGQKQIRLQLTDYLSSQGVHIGKGRIMILTNLCTLGYQFNPVSFYFCYDETGQPVCSVVEVGNTFREMKPYFLGQGTRVQHPACLLGPQTSPPLAPGTPTPISSRPGTSDPYISLPDTQFSFRDRQTKYFYVSPFIDMDASFDFQLTVPDETLDLRIDDHDQQGNRFFISTLKGKRRALTDTNLLKYFLSIPLITIKVIGLIHWQALRLWLKKTPYHKKEAHKHLQRDVQRPYKIHSANG